MTRAARDTVLAGECLEAFFDRDEDQDWEEHRNKGKAGARLIAKALIHLERLGRGQG